MTMTFNAQGLLTGITAPPPPATSPLDVSGTTITLRGTGAGAWVPGSVKEGGWTANGASPNEGGVAFNMAKTTQFGADYFQIGTFQVGYQVGQISSITIDERGTLFVNYSNEKSTPIGQVALASFNNDQGLTPVGSTSWKESAALGEPSYDSPLTGILGSVESRYLEESNVEMGVELVELVRAQSFYQAYAKTISTESTVMQTLLQMT